MALAVAVYLLIFFCFSMLVGTCLARSLSPSFTIAGSGFDEVVVGAPDLSIYSCV